LALVEARSSLRLRVLSALVLAPLPLAAIWFGGPFLKILIVAAAVVMAWEWARLCDGAPGLIAMVALAVAAAAVTGVRVGGVLALIGALTIWFFEVRRQGGAPLWMAAGCLWVALPCIIL